MKDLQNTPLLNTISALLENARKSVVVAVNQTMVLTYFEIGRTIVEDEQNGENRAEYGKRILKDLSIHLTEKFGRGFSEDNLSNMRNFYISYSGNSISETLFRKLTEEISEKSSQQTSEDLNGLLHSMSLDKTQLPSADFNLSWSHYLKLMRIKDINERKFYEIESFKNNWSLRELQRQYDSALYTRLSLIKNKEEIIQLSEKGQIFEKPKNLSKDPYILKFLDLPEQEIMVRYTLPNDHEQISASKYMTVLPTKEGFITIKLR